MISSVLKRFGIGDLPAGWLYPLLDELTTRETGHTPDKKKPEYWNGGIKWVSLADSHRLDNSFISETDKEISSIGIANSSARLLPPGVVVLSRDAGVGKSAITTCEMAVSQHFVAWFCGQELENRYLYYWLQFLKPEFERIANGSTIKTIGLPYFSKLRIALPPLAEQRKIAAILGTWDRAIGLLSNVIDEKKRKYLFLRKALVSGKEAPFETLFSIRVGGTPSRKDASLWETDRQPVYQWVTIGDMSGKYIYKTKEQISEKGAKTSRLELLQPNTLIFSFKLTIGKCAILKVPAYTNEAICALVPKNAEVLNADYAYHSIQEVDFLADADQAVKGKTLNQEKIRQLKLAVPNYGFQVSVARFLNLVENDVFLSEKQLALTKLQKSGLMQKLLTGEIRVKVDGEAVALGA